jgi:hypothetical protein
VTDEWEPDLALTEFVLARLADDLIEIEEGYGQECENVFSKERLLADCDAKRRLVTYQQGEWHWNDYLYSGEVCAYEEIVKYLALSYAAHPDYQPRWAKFYD